jgi:hypothetical protein
LKNHQPKNGDDWGMIYYSQIGGLLLLYPHYSKIMAVLVLVDFNAGFPEHVQ